jgi:predicted  nucleic acid-binding Zn-ribbon protein
MGIVEFECGTCRERWRSHMMACPKCGIAKTQKVDKKTKAALLKEVKEFDKAVIKFLDDLVIPD